MLTLEEEGAGLRVGGGALQEGEGVADAVGCVCGQRRWREQRVYGDNLLQQGRDGADAVPQVGCELRKGLPLLAEFQEGVLSRGRVGELKHIGGRHRPRGQKWCAQLYCGVCSTYDGRRAT